MAVFRYKQDAQYIGRLLAGLPEGGPRAACQKQLRDAMFPYLSREQEDFTERAKEIMEKAILQGPIRFNPVEMPEKGAIDVSNYRS